MLNFPLRYFPLLLLAALALFGLALGHLGASLVALRLAGIPALHFAVPQGPPGAGTIRPAQALLDYEIIVQRSLFAPQLAGQYTLVAKAESPGNVAAQPRGNIILLGTIAGGKRPLALTRSGSENRILHLGETLDDGAKVIAISRQLLKLRYPDGSEEIILPPELPGGEGTQAPVAEKSNAAVRNTTGNSYALSRAEVDKARSNLGELMKQARMEPHVVNGKTDGFEVKMLRPNTLFTALGLQLGDVIKQVNGLPLDSPEKALQIFQQLREAQHIVIAVVRDNTPMSLEYNLD
jgi:general secretion pathway protein C